MGRIDVSMPLFAGMPAFPGDPPFVSEPLRRVERGDPYSLTLLRLGSHAGTHLDPPMHFLPGAASVDRLDLDVLNGPAFVLRVPPERAEVGPAELRGIPPGTSRLLLRTANSERWARRLEFFPDYVALTLDGARTLRERGIRLVGIDALSIESDETDAFPVHRDLLGHGVPILEGLLLAEAPAGTYTLDCLPLRLRDGDGGPARVVLRPA
jgi:arylformamidase